MRWMRSRIVLGSLGLALLACDPAPNPSLVPTAPATTSAATVAPSSSPTSSTTSLPSPTDAPTTSAAAAVSCAGRGSSSTLVVYGDAGDLWRYDAASDDQRRITDDGDASLEFAPAFLGATCLLYWSADEASGPSIELLDFSGGAGSQTIVRERASIGELEVSPDSRWILYLQIDYDVDSTFRLKQLELGGGEPVVLHAFAPNLGRGAGSEDELSVAWAPDGSAILVVNTHEYNGEGPPNSIYLFDATGRTVRERWTGTHPRWSPDGRTIYYRGYAGFNGQRWRALDVQTMKTTILSVRAGTNNLSVSPDGRWLAYDTSWFGDMPLEASAPNGAPDVYVFDLTTGSEELLKQGALAPIWISATDLVVTNARRRPENSFNSWESLGTVTRMSVDGAAGPAEMTSTFDAAVYLGR
jgi:hypothetical protein